MLLKFFKGLTPAILATIILTSLLIWGKSLFSTEVFSFYFDNYPMPLYVLIKGLMGEHTLIEKIVALIITIASALYLIQLNTKHILIKYRTYLPVLLYIIFTSSFIPLQRINPAVFASPFLILATDNLLSSYEGKNSLDHFFRASFYIGIGSMIYLPLAAFIILASISLIILNNTGIRQWFVVLFGFITPWFFAFIYYFVWHNSSGMLFKIIGQSLLPIGEGIFHGIAFTVFYSFIGLLLVISLLFLLRNLPTQKINIRKYYSLFIWMVLFSAILVLFSSFSSIEMVYLAAIPSTFIIANYFTFAKSKFWTELFFSIMLVLTIAIQFF
jgi:hypothetical protein